MKKTELLFIPLLFILCLLPFIQMEGGKFGLHPAHIAMPGFFMLACVCFYAKGPKFVLYSAWIPFTVYAALLLAIFCARGLLIQDLGAALLYVIVMFRNFRNIRRSRS